eukprot:gb/GECG01003490.1/.p1 GENE.gb/GECG01003490.1/~~gb/GECG01003490.1/.p1  ORF type:complete len:229 (+),score=50.05 gb/GECG01003490.1/:1-687(+)
MASSSSGTSSGATKGVHNFKRRTFDTSKYEQIAKQEELQPKGDEEDALKRKGNSDGEVVEGPSGVRRVPGSKRAFLQERSWAPDLSKNLGKSKVISDPDQTQAFQSKVTGAVLRDSLAYLDHINGKRYNRQLGYSMRVERKSASDVRQKLAELKENDKKPKKRSAEEKLKEFDETMAEKRKKKRSSDSEGKNDESTIEGNATGDEAEGLDPEVAAVMGFKGFGGSKKS